MNMCLVMFILGLIPYGTLRASWTRMAISFQMLGTFRIEPPQIFPQSWVVFFFFFFLVFFSLYMGVLNIVPEVSETVLVYS